MWVDSINVFCKAASGLVLSKFKNGPRPIQPHRKTMINQEKIHTMYIPMSSLCLYHNKNDHNKNDDHHHNNDDNNNNQHQILSQSLLCLFFNPFVTPLLAFSERMGIAVWLSSQVALERAHRFVLFIYIYIYIAKGNVQNVHVLAFSLWGLWSSVSKITFLSSAQRNTTVLVLKVDASICTRIHCTSM